MTVAELIQHLSTMPMEAEVELWVEQHSTTNIYELGDIIDTSIVAEESEDGQPILLIGLIAGVQK